MITVKKELDEIDKQILRLSNDGFVNKEIARELNLAKKTVDNRLYEMRKYYKVSTTRKLISLLKGTNTLCLQ